ncbi:histidinol-phosphatase [Candidatus Poribacteria bacterium]|nr:histidinol-phosphatase [Candidatus Poribacteria bacterium]
MTKDFEYYEYVGVLHIHTKHSDGSGSVKRVIKTAQKVGLDYIVITDHNTIKSMENGAEGWYDNLLVMVGEEIGKYKQRHYLAVGIDEAIDPGDYDEDVEEYIRVVKEKDGVGFAAHPYELENKSIRIRLHPWEVWDNPDYTGMEIWSYMYDWAENLTILKIFYYYIHPEKAINGPPPHLLKRWDQVCQKRPVVGIGGADVHARHLFPFNFVKFLSYRRAFQGIRTHIITESPLNREADIAKQEFCNILKAGHCFFAHDFIADSKGFNFYGIKSEGGHILMGDEIEFEDGIELRIKSPLKTHVKIICNGEVLEDRGETDELSLKADSPGIYRVEARYGGKAWLFTNPIYMR